MFRFITIIALLLLLPMGVVNAQQPAPAEQVATGTFDVSIAPNAAVEGPVGLLALNKTWRGQLEGTSVGQMLGSGAPDQGRAAYVALELFAGSLDGRSGGFAFQQRGHMQPGSPPVMDVIIVPGSGTGQLAGISGTLEIRIEGNAHNYVLRYRLPR